MDSTNSAASVIMFTNVLDCKLFLKLSQLFSSTVASITNCSLLASYIKIYFILMCDSNVPLITIIR